MSTERRLDDDTARRILWSLPTGLYLLGSVGEVGRGPWNLMTTSLVTQVATSPRLIGLSIEADSVTAGLISSSGVAALSILDRSDKAVVRRFVKPVADAELGADGRAMLAGEEVRLLDGGGPPVHSRAGAWLGLEVRESLPLGSHVLVVAAPVTWGATEEFLAGRASERLFDVLRMEDTKMSYGG